MGKAKRKEKKVPAEAEVFRLEFDGASKGNPGKAGSGAILKRPDGSVLCELTKGVGIATCNFAEYQALIIGLKAALDKGVQHIKAHGDSKLVCKQVMGEWKAQSENLASSFAEVMELKKKFKYFSVEHVYREYNSAADSLANTATHLPDELVCNYIDIPNDKTSEANEDLASKKTTPREGSKVTCDSTIKSFSLSESYYRLEYHGVSKSNLNKSGAGAVLYLPDGSVHQEIKKGLGALTRNVANYEALLIGLQAALDCNVSRIRIQGDAVLVFKQMTGQMKVKDRSLLAMWEEANALLKRFSDVSLSHMGKGENSTACELAEAAVLLPENHLERSTQHNATGFSTPSNSIGFNINELRMSFRSTNKARNVSIGAYFTRLFSPCQSVTRTLYNPALKFPKQNYHEMLRLPISTRAPTSEFFTLNSTSLTLHRVTHFLPFVRPKCLPHSFPRTFMQAVGAMSVR